MGNTITGSGQVSLGDIYDEFTDTHSGAEEIQLTDYYDTGNAPASGEIQLAADFYGTSAGNTDRPGDGAYDSDAYTVLLIHSDTSNGSTTFDDSGATDHTITRTGAVHSTTQKKIGATSIYFDGSSNLKIPSHADWGFGAGDFTIDWWMLMSTPMSYDLAQYIFDHYEYDAPDYSYMRMYIIPDNSDTQGLTYGPSYITMNVVAPPVHTQGSYIHAGLEGAGLWAWNTWYHFACVRNGDDYKYYKNGVDALTGFNDNYSTFPNPNVEITIGSHIDGNQYLTGYIDEFRISKGIARWTSDFTVY
jgi:hypothetical protein